MSMVRIPVSLALAASCAAALLIALMDAKFGERIDVMLLLAAPLGGIAWCGNKLQAQLGLLFTAGWCVFGMIEAPLEVVANRLLAFLLLALVWRGSGLLKDFSEREKMLRQTDEVTEVFTRRCFLQKLTEEMRRSRRYQHCLTVISFDINNFHEVNEAGGQEEGDRVLKKVATLVKTHLRQGDLIGRVGADEFAVLLPETKNENADCVIQKLKQLLTKEALKNYWPVSFSFGAITFEEVPESLEEVLSALEEVVSYAKKDGKNHVRHDKM